ncbi:hypothetical protein WN48_11250 [Eufriesea mexicana]|uniref:Uncharacterized protein n=1 Tax=Eufriesea mexicana TaxID=516756 RepID=A0A310S5N8_9HYME|nr:hypothetical protein WN48_11250 [Eufriesea mexicana]
MKEGSRDDQRRREDEEIERQRCEIHDALRSIGASETVKTDEQEQDEEGEEELKSSSFNVYLLTVEEQLTCVVTARCLYGQMVSLTKSNGNSQA